MNMLEETYELLENDPRSLTDISQGAGVNFHWLGKFKQRKFEDPGFTKVSKLHQFLITTQQPRQQDEGAAA